MQLFRKNTWTDTDYVCTITEILDKFKKIGINKESGYCHYIFIWGEDIQSSNDIDLPIRLPGRTVGTVVIKKGVVKNVYIDSDLGTVWYKEGVNDLLCQYIGCPIKL